MSPLLLNYRLVGAVSLPLHPPPPPPPHLSISPHCRLPMIDTFEKSYHSHFFVLLLNIHLFTFGFT